MSLHYQQHLTLGFAGKRQHEGVAKMEEPLRQLFKAFDKKLKRNEIRLINGLADGADLLAMKVFCELFLEPRTHKHRKIGAVLPFVADDFKKTLTLADSPGLFYKYYPLCDQKLELDGNYLPGDDEPAFSIKNKAYVQQGKVLAHISDILIAVTPYDAGSNPGGTVETLLSSLYLKKPVIHYDLNDHKFYLYRSISDWLPANRKANDPEWIVDHLIQSLPSGRTYEAEKLNQGKVFILRKISWLFYERFVRRKKREQHFFVEFFVLFGSLFKKKKDVKLKPAPEKFETLHDLLTYKQEQLDEPAQYFQYHYRGGYILNYFLALFAIFLAVISIVSSLESGKLICPETVPRILLVAGLIKLVIIYLLIVNTRRINRFQYNKKAIDYRYAAERLRINAYLGIIGVLRAPKPALGNHSKKHFFKYKGEDMYQAVMMEPLCHPFQMVVTTAKLREFVNKLKTEWIFGQLAYHRKEAGLMDNMDERLEKIPARLAIIVFLVVILDLLIVFFVENLHIDLCPGWEKGLLFTLPFLLGLTALLPAVVTTLNSIRFQSDAHRLAARSGNMVEELSQLEIRINEVEHDLEHDEEGSHFGTVMEIMDEAATLLTDEVAEWSLIYEKRVYEQG